MIACSEYSQVYLVLGPTFSGLLCMCTCLQRLQCDLLLAFRHLVCIARLSGCEPQRMRLLMAEISNGL